MCRGVVSERGLCRLLRLGDSDGGDCFLGFEGGPIVWEGVSVGSYGDVWCLKFRSPCVSAVFFIALRELHVYKGGLERNVLQKNPQLGR